LANRAFGQGLKEEGFVEGQNAVVDYRYADTNRSIAGFGG
jgi:hypothetical protein